MHIIKAEEQHITAIRNIYAHHVLHGTGNFETEPPDTQEMLNRLRSIQSRGFPWYVALQAIRSLATVIFPVTANAMLIGSRLKIRYILIRLISAGVGKALLDHALKWAESQGYRQMIAVVGDSANVASVALHIRAGFTEIGTLRTLVSNMAAGLTRFCCK